MPARREPDYPLIEGYLSRVQRKGRQTLTEPEAKEVLALAGIPVPTEMVATSAAEAARFARRIGFPVALKIVSSDLPHKSDVGGVQLGVRSQQEVRRAFAAVVSRVRRTSRSARIEGVLVQQHLSGREVILGATHDAQLGPVVVFGLGGTAVEILGDVAFRLVPDCRAGRMGDASRNQVGAASRRRTEAQPQSIRRASCGRC